MLSLAFTCTLLLGNAVFDCFAADTSASSKQVQAAQSRNGYGGYSGYDGYGGGYNNNYGYGSYGVSSYGSSGLGGFGELLTGVLGTLAGLALLAALAAAIFAPLAFVIGRKRRDVGDFSPEVQKKMKEMEILQQFIRSIPDVESQPQRLMSNYLTCSGLINTKNQCLEKLACEFQTPGNFSAIESGAMSVIFDTIIGNKFIDANFRERLQKASVLGKSKKDCKIFTCTDYLSGTMGS